MFVGLAKREPEGSPGSERLLGRSVPLLRAIGAFWPATAAVFLVAAAGIAASLFIHPNREGSFGACLTVITIWIAAVDAQRFRIPNSAVLLGAVLGLVHAGMGEFASSMDVGLALLRGAILALMFAGLRSGYRLLRGRDGLGLGDVKLAAVAGIWLDWDIAALAISFASFAALLFYVTHQYLNGRPLLATSRVPFGLFFAPAIWLGWLFQTPWLSTF